MIFVYIAATAVIGFTAFAAYHTTVGYGETAAVCFAGLAAVGAGLLWPIPIHGGFTFLGGMLYNEAVRAWNAPAARRPQAAVLSPAGSRVPLPFGIVQALEHGWYLVSTAGGTTAGGTTAGGTTAWLDERSGLLWTEWLPLATGAPMPTVADAEARCALHPPAGRWSAARETDNYWAWKHRGREILPGAPASSVSIAMVGDMPMATYRIRRSAGGNDGRETSAGFVVRCVAPGTPGTMTGDGGEIPLADWNRYQLN